MNGLALDSGEFISADELNARWLPRKATEEEMIEKQPKALQIAEWLEFDNKRCLSNQSHLIGASTELRRLAAVEQELEELKRAISEAEPVAWANPNDMIDAETSFRWIRVGDFSDPVYTLKGIK